MFSYASFSFKKNQITATKRIEKQLMQKHKSLMTVITRNVKGNIADIFY